MGAIISITGKVNASFWEIKIQLYKKMAGEQRENTVNACRRACERERRGTRRGTRTRNLCPSGRLQKQFIVGKGYKRCCNGQPGRDGTTPVCEY